MTERRLQLRIREHNGDERHEEHAVGPEGRPPFVVVLRGCRTAAGETGDLLRALEQSPVGERLAGSPVLFLHEGQEFELWEIEREAKP